MTVGSILDITEYGSEIVLYSSRKQKVLISTVLSHEVILKIRHKGWGLLQLHSINTSRDDCDIEFVVE